MTDTRNKPQKSGAYDLLELAERSAAEEGFDLAQALWAAMRTLIQQAAEGDAAAAKLVLDRLAGPVRHAVELPQDVHLQVVTGVPEQETP